MGFWKKLGGEYKKQYSRKKLKREIGFIRGKPIGLKRLKTTTRKGSAIFKTKKGKLVTVTSGGQRTYISRQALKNRLRERLRKRNATT